MHHSTIEDLLISYYDGKATADEIQEIEAWIKLSDENKKKAMDIYTLLLMTDTQQITEKMDMNEELSKVKGRMQENKYHISWWGWIQRAAVALLIPMAITILVLLNQPQSTAPVHAQIFEVRTQPGMIISFRLPDSTLVYLNSGSVLKYPSIFTGNIREVSLNGEAYFEVAKDTEHKFIVSTPQKSKVEVLGTHFNLEAFDEMDEVITTLVEGKVEFVYEKDGQGSKILMCPGQKVIYNNKDGQILSYNTNGESELAWMDQKVIFDKTPFKAALHILKKRYNVDFIVNTSKFDKYTFTGAFTEQYIEEILENFKISSHIRWRNVKLTNNQSEERRQIEIY